VERFFHREASATLRAEDTPRAQIFMISQTFLRNDYWNFRKAERKDTGIGFGTRAYLKRRASINARQEEFLARERKIYIFSMFTQIVTNLWWDYSRSFNCPLGYRENPRIAIAVSLMFRSRFTEKSASCTVTHMKYVRLFFGSAELSSKAIPTIAMAIRYFVERKKTIEMSAEKRGCQLHPRRLACSFLGKRPLLSAIVAFYLTYYFPHVALKYDRRAHLGITNKPRPGSLALVNYRAR